MSNTEFPQVSVGIKNRLIQIQEWLLILFIKLFKEDDFRHQKCEPLKLFQLLSISGYYNSKSVSSILYLTI